MPKRLWCAGCGAALPPNKRYERLDFWKAAEKNVPLSFWCKGPEKGKSAFVNVVCADCASALRKPYLVPRPDGTHARAVHVNSRIIRTAAGQRVAGLLLLDALAKNTPLVYPGVLVSTTVLDRWDKELGIKVASNYGKGGVKGRGFATILLAQFTSPNERHLCAHLVNCKTSTKAQSNAQWGEVKVDAAFNQKYPFLGRQARMGERWPAMRISRDIAPGNEVLVSTYGSAYWRKHTKETRWKHTHEEGTLYQMRAISPQMQRIMDEDAMVGVRVAKATKT